MINYSILQTGQRFKDYVALCEYLGLPVRKGNSKSAQLKDLMSHFSWHRDGRAYVIDKVFGASETAPETVVLAGYVYHRGSPIGGVNDAIHDK